MIDPLKLSATRKGRALLKRFVAATAGKDSSSTFPISIVQITLENTLWDTGNDNYSLLPSKVYDKLKKADPSIPNIDTSLADRSIPFLNNTSVNAQGIVTLTVHVEDVHHHSYTADVVFAVVDLDYFDAILNNHTCKVLIKQVHYNAANWEQYLPNPLKDTSDDIAPEHLEDLYPNAASDFILNLLDPQHDNTVLRTETVSIDSLPPKIQQTLANYHASVFTPDSKFIVNSRDSQSHQFTFKHHLTYHRKFTVFRVPQGRTSVMS